MYGCEWFKVYDIIETMHASFAENDRERGENDAASFADEINAVWRQPNVDHVGS